MTREQLEGARRIGRLQHLESVGAQDLLEQHQIPLVVVEQEDGRLHPCDTRDSWLKLDLANNESSTAGNPWAKSSLGRKASAPAAIAPMRCSSLSSSVIITILGAASRPLIREVTAKPFMPGMLMSMNMRSGRSVLARASPSPPDFALGSTSKLPLRARNCPTALANCKLSSTTMTLMRFNVPSRTRQATRPPARGRPPAAEFPHLRARRRVGQSG